MIVHKKCLYKKTKRQNGSYSLIQSWWYVSLNTFIFIAACVKESIGKSFSRIHWFISKENKAKSFLSFEVHYGVQTAFHSHCFVSELKWEPCKQNLINGTVLIHWKYRPNSQLTESVNKPEEEHVK